LGRKKLFEFLEFKKIDPDFFAVLQNRINLQFSYDLMTALSLDGFMSGREVKKIAKPFSGYAYHGSVASLFKNHMNPQSHLMAWLKRMDRYQINFNYVAEKNDSVVLGTPASFIGAFHSAAEVTKAYCEVKAQTMETVMSLSGEKGARVRKTHCFFKGDAHCQFQVMS